MAAQLSYCYSANRKTHEPLPLLLASFNGRLRERYESVGDQQHKLWKGVEWWEDDYTRLWKGPPSQDTIAGAGEDTAASKVEMKEGATPSETSTATGATPASAASTSTVTDPITYGLLSGQPRSTSDQSKVVYLTGDSPNVLGELEPGTTYILGGIVDRNRYKSLCLNKAIEHGIAHAQLPIGEFLPEMTTRKVLTVNQVFEIMVCWVKERARGGKEAWGTALREVMPTRKYDPLHRVNKKAGLTGQGEDEEEDDYEDVPSAEGEAAPDAPVVVNVEEATA